MENDVFLLGGQIIFSALACTFGFFYALNALENVNPSRMSDTVLKFGLGVGCCAFGLLLFGISVRLAMYGRGG